MALLKFSPAQSFNEDLYGPDKIDTTPALAIYVKSEYGDTSMFDIDQAIDKIWGVAKEKISAIKY
ncbi:MAG: hypothetical protein Q8N09_05870 [Thermodesulfovibrionia bacterium]|nr:hypothetical protein [Thermodesulfovibrionia bacterium]